MSEFRVGERVKHRKFVGTIVEIDDISARVFVEEQGNTRWVELNELTSVDELARLQAENARLRDENKQLEMALKEVYERVYEAYDSNTPHQNVYRSVFDILNPLGFRMISECACVRDTARKALEGGE